MREFPSMTEFGAHLAELAIAEVEYLHHGLDHAAALIEREAKREFGHYQPETGPFPEWAPLAESTMEERARLGFSEDEPLKRTGELRDSISRAVHGLDAVIGSTSDLMIYHEFGTSRMPARPVLGPAAFRNRRAVETLVAEAALLGIIGAREFAIAKHQLGFQSPVHQDLGYDFNVSAE